MTATRYTGRFAPSPTGDLHFGSLVAAVGSFLQARANDGRWIIRMEDLDTPRVVPGSAERLLEDLRHLGMSSDEPVRYQGTRTDAYQTALDQLIRQGQCFPCACSRSELPPGPYPGTCRSGLLAGKTGRSYRVIVNDEPIEFDDAVQGPQVENLSESCGDFVIKRADGLFAYQLAVVVDDAWQDITEVVRGADLIDSTPRQIYLQRLLNLPTPSYLHLPVALGPDGRKLSKRFESDPVNSKPPLEALGEALTFLGHPPPEHRDLEQRWAWAHEHWDTNRIPIASSPKVGA